MSLKWLTTLKTLAVKENNMSSKFATPFLKKSPLLGAYENAADGKAFMGGLVTGQEQFAKLQQDLTKGFDNYMKGEGTQQRLEKDSLDKINEKYPLGKVTNAMGKISEERPEGYDEAKAAHDKRFNSKSKGLTNAEASKICIESGKLGVYDSVKQACKD